MKFILLSDLHLGASPYATARLEAALADVRAKHADAEHIFLLGDLSDRGAIEDYSTLKQMLTTCQTPATLLLGNHDDRDAFRTVFPSAFRHGGQWAQGLVQIGAGVPAYVLDSLDAGQVGGSLDEGRLDMLEHWLGEADKPGFLMLHHPPMPLGLPAYDAGPIVDGERLRSLIRHFREKLLAVFFGHCHMPISGVIDGVPALCVPALAAPSLPIFHRAAYATDCGGAGGYGVVLLSPNSVVLHRVSLPDLAREPGQPG